MPNPTLISGFEDVIAHINQQEQRVMALEEENKKLKEDIKKLREKTAEHLGMAETLHDTVVEENEQLREEIKDLNEEVNDRVVIEDIAELFGSDEGDHFDWESEIGGMIEENKKLKEENKKLKQELFLTKMKLVSANENADVEKHNEAAGIVIAENKKLEEENEKLKEDIEGDGWLKQGYKTELSNSHKQQNRMVKEITKLKEEIKDLKADLQQSHRVLKNIRKDNEELKAKFEKFKEVLTQE